MTRWTALFVLFAGMIVVQTWASDRYEVNDGWLSGTYEFYQDPISPDQVPFGFGDLTRVQLELLVPDESKLCADRSARCQMVNLQLVPVGSGKMRLQAELQDPTFERSAISIDLESDEKTGGLTGEKRMSVDEAQLTDAPQLSRITFVLLPMKDPHGLAVPRMTLESEAVSRGSFGGVYHSTRTHVLLRAEDK